MLHVQGIVGCTTRTPYSRAVLDLGCVHGIEASVFLVWDRW